MQRNIQNVVKSATRIFLACSGCFALLFLCNILQDGLQSLNLLRIGCQQKVVVTFGGIGFQIGQQQVEILVERGLRNCVELNGRGCFEIGLRAEFNGGKIEKGA